MKLSVRRALAPVGAACAAVAVLSACTNPSSARQVTAPAADEVSIQAVQKGPNPTDASLSASRGPFAITSARVARGNGFGGGTIYYPTDTSQGTYGGIVVVPGFLSAESSIQWYGPRIASHGFVVLTIATNSTTDYPPSRSQQQQSALRYLTTSSVAASRVDRTRLGAMGWSMGGGGTLQTAAQMANIKAAIPLAPWNTTVYQPSVPTMIVSCQNDSVAPNGSHSNRFYPALRGEKAILEVRGGSHFCVTTENTMIAKYAISWLKRFIDDDTRYAPFICTSTPSGASKYQNSCPL